MKKIFLIVIVLFGTISTVFSQNSFRNAVLLSHSSGARLYDYDTYMGVDSGVTSIPLEMDDYNIAKGYTGADTVGMVHRWFPINPFGTGWYHYLEAFRGTIDGTTDDWLAALPDTFNVIAYKGGIASTYMTGYGTPEDTAGINSVYYLTIYNYKWIWRELLKIMGAHPETFWVLMTGSAGGDENNTVLGAQLSHEFSIWAKDTLAMGLDATFTAQYGAFPANVYVFDYFHYLADNEYFLKDSYESGRDWQNGQDDHPNATACDVIAPIFVQEVFDAAIAYESIVPVELMLFRGNYKDGVVNLEWITATETNNLGFEVERRNDFTSYESIGFVNGIGTSTNRITYNFVDSNVSSYRNYYRLKQIDMDGTFEYSNEVQIEIGALMNFQLYQNYPNPFNPSTEISFTLAKSGNVTLMVYNNLGSEVATLANGFFFSGKHSVKFNAKDLTSGIYFYRINSDNFTSTRKMILIK